MNIEKLIEAMKLCGSTPKVDQCKQCAYWSGGDMSKCIPRMTTDAATTLSTLQAENEKLRAELERKNEALDFSKTTDAETVRLKADLIRVTAERDALIKRTAGDCWSCIRRYECNNRKGPHKRCWEFDPWLLRED